jgi:hypothetical protein
VESRLRLRSGQALGQARAAMGHPACQDSVPFMELNEVVADIADALVKVDGSGDPFRGFGPGVGPYGEPQVVKRIAACMNDLDKYHNAAITKRTPDLLIPGEWAIEVKIARPYGDNDREAEDWSVNLLHPYPGNVSTIGDCYKLVGLQCCERKAVVVIGYEHNPAKIDLTPLVAAFEVVAKEVAGMRLSSRVELPPRRFGASCAPMLAGVCVGNNWANRSLVLAR